MQDTSPGSRSSPALQVAPSGFFVARTPLLPFDELLAWGNGLSAPASLDDPGALRTALKEDRRLLRKRLAVAMSRPELREALFLASPDVAEALAAWETDPESERARDLEPTVVAYFSRAAARPTPFGLFAGCTTGAVGDRTRVRLQARSSYGRHSRLDTDYLSALAEAIGQDRELRDQLVYRPNSSLCEVGGRLRLAATRKGGGGRSYQLVAVEPTPYLEAVLDRARAGATLDELAAVLVGDEVSRDEADDYLDELIVGQILVSELGPVVTGDEPIHPMIDVLATAPATEPIGRVLAGARQALQEIDSDGVGVCAERYRALRTGLDDLPARPQLARLVQVDLVKPATQAVLGSRLMADLVRGVRLLQRVAPVRSSGALTRFREAFTQRYETREVPLAECLDEETGIGFDRSLSPVADGAPLLAGLPFPADRPEPRWDDRSAYLLERLTLALSERRSEIRLEPDDLDMLDGGRPDPLPDAFAVVAAVAAESGEAIARGDYRVLLQAVTGPSGVPLLGRFCHGDERLLEEVRAHLRAEEAHRPDAAFAEIVHLPEGRVGNVVCRPVLRDYEIPYLGRSGARPGSQLPVTDLLVSVHGDRVVLRSRRLGREVVPRLTTAHAYEWRGLGTYRFLCALQRQDAGTLAWDWGPLATAPFLPRVTSGRLVLARASWRLRKEEIAALRDGDECARFATIQTWRSARSLPRYVALVDGDNELVTDLDNTMSVSALARQLRNRPAATLVEMLPGPGDLWVAGPEGRFVSQFVVPFVRTCPAPSARDPARSRPAPRTGPGEDRRFPPGSEWLYAKLYTGTASADRVLERLADPVLSTALGSGAADRWFFIRYADPDTHLRLRIHGPPESLLADVLPTLHAALVPLIEEGQVWRVQLDTYEREIERYGGLPAIGLVEQVFAADSDAALAIVRSLSGDAGLDLRWRLALVGIDLLFQDLGLDLEDRRLLTRRQREGLGHQLGTGSELRSRVGTRFRQERGGLELLTDPTADPPPESLPGLAALGARSRRIAPLAAELRRLERSGQLRLADVAASLAHMHVNRVLRAAQPAQELVLYEMLDRLYSGRAARARL